jgi:hypothetical protein
MKALSRGYQYIAEEFDKLDGYGPDRVRRFVGNSPADGRTSDSGSRTPLDKLTPDCAPLDPEAAEAPLRFPTANPPWAFCTNHPALHGL